jgi:hypothetical protein
MKWLSKRTLIFGVSLSVVLAIIGFTGHVVKAQAATQTNLLFNMVTDQVGFDTILVIANTSQDQYGTSAVSGGCVLHFFGANAPGNSIIKLIPAGSVRPLLLSSVAPNFQGYVIATCNFPLAHGWFAQKRATASNFLAANQALVLPSSRTGLPFESLTH